MTQYIHAMLARDSGVPTLSFLYTLQIAADSFLAAAPLSLCGAAIYFGSTSKHFFRFEVLGPIIFFGGTAVSQLLVALYGPEALGWIVVSKSIAASAFIATGFWIITNLGRLSRLPYLERSHDIRLEMEQSGRERRILEEKLATQRAKTMNAAKMAALGEMAAGIGHEINNPLAAILASVEDLKDIVGKQALSSEELLKRLDRVERSGQRIRQIVRSLRTLAKDEDSNVLQPASLSRIIEDTLTVCRERFYKNHIELRVQPVPKEWMLDCQPEKISQALLNLLNNAFDAVQDAPTKWISIDAEITEGTVRILVTDSGSGVPIENRTKILQPFFSTKGPDKGMGLGLSLSDSIVRQHGGELFLNPRHPSTQFVIELPRLIAPAGVERVAAQ